MTDTVVATISAVNSYYTSRYLRVCLVRKAASQAKRFVTVFFFRVAITPRELEYTSLQLLSYFALMQYAKNAANGGKRP